MNIQEWIHRLEVGGGTRYVRLAVVVFGFLALALLYNLFEFRNLANPEAMDAAQLARNVARGDGFTTQFVRPLSIHLVEQHQLSRGSRTNDFGMVDHGHPDLANPPLYPLLLAGVMKVLPFEYEIPSGRRYRHYHPDLLIALFNQGLFLLLACLTFRLANRLFDSTVAWGSVIVLVGSELMWRFSISGLPTLLLSNIFVLLVMCLASIERGARDEEDPASRRRLILLSLGAGLLVGLGALTKYSFGWLIIPVILFLAVYVPRWRPMLPAAAVLAFVVALAPWLARNHALSGTLFGTAGYAWLAEIYPGNSDEIQRSLELPTTESSIADAAIRKLLSQLPSMLQDQFLALGGSWITAFFLVGLLVPFVDRGRNRLRVFLVAVLAMCVFVQALGRTELSKGSSVNGENLLILVAPVVFIFGIALFSMLLDQLPLTFFRAREVVTAGFLVILCLPLLLTLLPPRRVVHAFPPYQPLLIQEMCGWMEKDELIMGDMPWATAWYGDQLSVWLTRMLADPKHQNDFYAINDLHRPIHAVHLSHLSLDKPMFTGIYANQDHGSWERFLFGLLQARSTIQQRVTQQASDGLISDSLNKQIAVFWRSTFKEFAPEGFPLQQCPLSYVGAGQLFLTDRVRWTGSNR